MIAIFNETLAVKFQGFFQMGMDSLMSVELRKKLEVLTGRSLPAMLTFKYPTPAAIVEFLDTVLNGEYAAAAAAGGDDEVTVL